MIVLIVIIPDCSVKVILVIFPNIVSPNITNPVVPCG